ncbi:C-type lectin domain family 2 member B-like isoform X2 [Anomalospiza imberbis]|uniref:C-type lectin domain family 2 member B-like isoform X2 n=1 Tax=Anomalospiza imberbis TaxID=187417 RepID=UPI00358F0044
MEEMRVYSGFLGMERNKRAGHSMEMKPEAHAACQVMLAVLFTALFITAIAFAVQAFQPHAQPCFQCPFDWIRYRGKCYYFSEVEGNWTSSQNNCSALGASLAMLDSTEDLSFVMRYKGISEHWIGLLREDEDQPWQWVNRSPLSHLLSEMRLYLPSGLPKELEKSLSSCCHQSDALWEALEKFRNPIE